MLALALPLSLALLLFAFIAAPHSCVWGLSAYFIAGITVVFILAAGGFLLSPGKPIGTRIVHVCLVTLTGIAIWLTGFFAADFQLLCRLF